MMQPSKSSSPWYPPPDPSGGSNFRTPPISRSPSSSQSSSFTQSVKNPAIQTGGTAAAGRSARAPSAPPTAIPARVPPQVPTQWEFEGRGAGTPRTNFYHRFRRASEQTRDPVAAVNQVMKDLQHGFVEVAEATMPVDNQLREPVLHAVSKSEKALRGRRRQRSPNEDEEDKRLDLEHQRDMLAPINDAIIDQMQHYVSWHKDVKDFREHLLQGNQLRLDLFKAQVESLETLQGRIKNLINLCEGWISTKSFIPTRDGLRKEDLMALGSLEDLEPISSAIKGQGSREQGRILAWGLSSLPRRGVGGPGPSSSDDYYAVSRQGSPGSRRSPSGDSYSMSPAPGRVPRRSPSSDLYSMTPPGGRERLLNPPGGSNDPPRR